MQRRRFLQLGIGAGAVVAAGAAGVVAVEERAVPGRAKLNEIVGATGTPGTIPAVAPPPMTSGSFVSAARGGLDTGWTVARPAGVTTPLPVVVVLHGLGGDHSTAFSELGLDRFLTQTVVAGTPPFALASVDGGTTYWHHRGSGEDAGAMVRDELIPMLGATPGLDITRLGFHGWSMGGYGSMLLGGELGAARVRAIAVSSPALWLSSGDTAPGAFDDADDYAANTIFDREDTLAGIPLRIDCGEDDPFYEATSALRDQLSPTPAGGFSPGNHDDDFWRHVAPDQLAFLGRALAGQGPP